MCSAGHRYSRQSALEFYKEEIKELVRSGRQSAVWQGSKKYDEIGRQRHDIGLGENYEVSDKTEKSLQSRSHRFSVAPMMDGPRSAENSRSLNHLG
jgi:hypothetical protein